MICNKSSSNNFILWLLRLIRWNIKVNSFVNEIGIIWGWEKDFIGKKWWTLWYFELGFTNFDEWSKEFNLYLLNRRNDSSFICWIQQRFQASSAELSKHFKLYLLNWAIMSSFIYWFDLLNWENISICICWIEQKFQDPST